MPLIYLAPLLSPTLPLPWLDRQLGAEVGHQALIFQVLCRPSLAQYQSYKILLSLDEYLITLKTSNVTTSFPTTKMSLPPHIDSSTDGRQKWATQYERYLRIFIHFDHNNFNRYVKLTDLKG
jgi:hypothetical protein